MRKMKNLIKKSSEINKKLTEKLIQLEQNEERLKLLSKKSNKSKKEYEQLLKNKQTLIQKYEIKANADQDRICLLLGMKIKNKNKEEIRFGTSTAEESDKSISNVEVPARRISYYNLK